MKGDIKYSSLAKEPVSKSDIYNKQAREKNRGHEMGREGGGQRVIVAQVQSLKNTAVEF